MRLRRLDLERYGAFTDKPLIFREDARVHIIHGANEAGKTSALAAIGDWLFGFPKDTPFAYLHPTKDLRIGGSLTLDNAQTLEFRRRKGNKDTLRDADDKPLDEALLDPVLGRITRKTFDEEYGLSAESLRKGGKTLLGKDGKLADLLAAGSANLAALSSLRDSLDEQAKALFTPGRRVASQPFYSTTARLYDARTALKNTGTSIEAWKSAKAHVEQLIAARDDLAQQIKALSLKQKIMVRAGHTVPLLRKLDAARNALNALPPLPHVAATEVTRWEQAALRLRDLHREHRALAQDIDDRKAQLAALQVDDALVAHSAQIEALREKIGAVDEGASDRPKRVEAMRAAERDLNEEARKLGFVSGEELVANLPTEPLLAALQEAIGTKRRLDDRLKTADEKRDQRLREAQEIERRLAPHAHAFDPAPLRLRLNAFAALERDVAQLQQARSNSAALRQKHEDAKARLKPPVAPATRLATLALPDPAQVLDIKKHFDALEESNRALEQKTKLCEQALRDAEQALKELATQGQLTTRADLLTARTRRDEAVAQCETSADFHASKHKLVSELRHLDDVTDHLLSDTRRTAQVEEKERILRQQRALHTTLKDEHNALEQARLRNATSWKNLWHATGLTPLDPQFMLVWIDALNALRREEAELDTALREQATRDQHVESHRAALLGLAHDLHISGLDAAPIATLMSGLTQALTQAEKNWNDARLAAHERDLAKANQAEAEAEHAKAQQLCAEHRAQWQELMRDLGLRREAGLGEAESAARIWHIVPGLKQAFDREKRSVTGIDRYRSQFADDVCALLGALGREGTAENARALLLELTESLAKARTQANQRHHGQNECAKQEARSATMLRDITGLNAVLAEARQHLALPEDSPVEEALEIVQTRHRLTQELAQITSELATHDDGKTEEDLRAETAGIDLALLRTDAEMLDRERDALNAEQAQVISDYNASKKQFDALGADDPAARAAQEKAEAEDELVRISEDWLVTIAAARLAGRAIERHRARAQDPILARASQLFQTLTGHAYSGLAPDYEEDDHPRLKGRKADGALVAVEQMSEGTRDQLFLTLRLALLEAHQGESLPFIGDDLLASFDEQRTRFALDLLSDFGAKHQTILFTHHAHVAELAQDHLGARADVIRL